MNKVFHILLFFALTATSLTAQTTSRAVTDLMPNDFISGSTPLMPVRLSHIEPFLAYAIEWEASAEIALEIRFHEAGRSGEWLPLQPDAHSDRKAPEFISQLGFAPAATSHFEVRIFPRDAASDFIRGRAHFFSPGKSDHAPAANQTVDVLSCPCPIPGYLDRAGWCPSGNCPQDPTPVFTAVTHLIVHHSAGSNSSSDWAAVVRSIWDYHVNSNGWDDIGYNWLIDPNGVLYEGRGNDLLGAHFCGTNGNTMGVCMMGTYTNIPPSDTSLLKLTALLAWKACDREIDPEDFEFHAGSGLNLFNISGHRDGCSTACPGDSLYARLPVLRTNVRDFIDDCEPSSTFEKTEDQSVLIFPNPAKDILNLLMPPNGRDMYIRVFDPQGRMVWQSHKPCSAGEQISLSIKGWAKGWYTVHQGSPPRVSKIFVQ